MGKCIICGCNTNDFRCSVRKENGKSYDDYQCDECTKIKVEKESEEYTTNFNTKVLPYLLDNDFKVVVECGLDEEGVRVIEEFPIKDEDVMYCVDIIRERMYAKGYYENWIDIGWVEHNGIEFEVVDYLCYALRDAKGNANNEVEDDVEDDESDNWVSYNLSLVGKSGLKLEKVY